MSVDEAQLMQCIQAHLLKPHQGPYQSLILDLFCAIVQLLLPLLRSYLQYIPNKKRQRDEREGVAVDSITALLLKTHFIFRVVRYANLFSNFKYW